MSQSRYAVLHEELIKLRNSEAKLKSQVLQYKAETAKVREEESNLKWKWEQDKDELIKKHERRFMREYKKSQKKTLALETELTKKGDLNKVLEERVTSLEEEKKLLSNKVQTLQKVQKVYDQREQDLECFQNAKAEIKRLNAHISMKKSEMDDLSMENVKFQKQIEELTEELEKVKKELISSRTTADEESRKWTKIERKAYDYERVSEAFHELNRKFPSLEKELEKYKDENVTEKKLKSSLKEECHRLKEKIKELSEENDSYKKAIDKLTADADLHRAEKHSRCVEMLRQNTLITVLQGKLTEAQEKIENFKTAQIQQQKAEEKLAHDFLLDVDKKKDEQKKFTIELTASRNENKLLSENLFMAAKKLSCAQEIIKTLEDDCQKLTVDYNKSCIKIQQLGAENFNLKNNLDKVRNRMEYAKQEEKRKIAPDHEKDKRYAKNLNVAETTIANYARELETLKKSDISKTEIIKHLRNEKHTLQNQIMRAEKENETLTVEINGLKRDKEALTLCKSTNETRRKKEEILRKELGLKFIDFSLPNKISRQPTQKFDGKLKEKEEEIEELKSKLCQEMKGKQQLQSKNWHLTEENQRLKGQIHLFGSETEKYEITKLKSDEFLPVRKTIKNIKEVLKHAPSTSKQIVSRSIPVTPIRTATKLPPIKIMKEDLKPAPTVSKLEIQSKAITPIRTTTKLPPIRTVPRN